MGLIIEGGEGKGYSAGVDSENRLKTLAITQSMEHHANQSEGEAYSIPFSQKPTAADDCIFYMKNTDDVDMVIEGVTLGATDPGANDSVYFKLGDSGTRSGETALTPVNLNSGSGNKATGTFEKGADLTAGTLTGGTEFERIVLAAAAATDKVSSGFNFSQDVIVPKNGVFTIYIGGSNAGTYYITVHIHYHE